MSDFKVDPALMAKGQQMVQAASTEINGYLKTLQSDVDELLPGWQSSGATSFARAHQAWSEKARTVSTALDDLGQKLGVVGRDTTKGDAGVADSFRGFAN